MATPVPSALPIGLDDRGGGGADRGGGRSARRRCIRQTLSEMTGAEVWLKFENLQFTAAYKERGALNALLLLQRRSAGARRDRGVGGQSCAGRSPITAPGSACRSRSSCRGPRRTVKVSQTESVGAEVVLEGETFDDAYAHARAAGASSG